MVKRTRERLASGLFAPIDDVRLALGRFGPRGWLAAAGAGLVTLLAVGLVTAVIENPLFIRMTPVRPQDYVIWLASGLLVGLIAGTFVGPAPARHGGKTISGGVLSVLAVGCPICNKLVVLLLGVSGALTIFEPAQLYLGVVSVVLLAWTLRLRARAVGERGRRVPYEAVPPHERPNGA
jgi:hypothetical protein